MATDKQIINKIKGLENEVEDFKQERWKAEFETQKYERKRFPTRKQETRTKYKKRIEKVYIELIKMISKIEVLKDILNNAKRGKNEIRTRILV